MKLLKWTFGISFLITVIFVVIALFQNIILFSLDYPMEWDSLIIAGIAVICCLIIVLMMGIYGLKKESDKIEIRNHKKATFKERLEIIRKEREGANTLKVVKDKEAK